MNKGFINFLTGLLILSIVLCLTHYYLFHVFFSEFELYLPIWSIYAFNIVMVVGIFTFLSYKIKSGAKNGHVLFSMLTLLKMVFAIVFLSPLFFNKSDHTVTEVFNFFIPYFIYLIYEIYSLDKFFKTR
jgi:hypothetical protein